MSRKKLYEHFIITNWRGLASKIKEDSIIKRISSRSILENRGDDTLETIKTRIEKYYQETKPVLQHYYDNQRKIFRSINGDREIADINSLILNLLKKQ